MKLQCITESLDLTDFSNSEFGPSAFWHTYKTISAFCIVIFCSQAFYKHPEEFCCVFIHYIQIVVSFVHYYLGGHPQCWWFCRWMWLSGGERSWWSFLLSSCECDLSCECLHALRATMSCNTICSSMSHRFLDKDVCRLAQPFSTCFPNQVLPLSSCEKLFTSIVTLDRVKRSGLCNPMACFQTKLDAWNACAV